MRTRADNIAIINELWGAPGQPYDTDQGLRLFRRVVEGMGLIALTDDAVERLMQAHLFEEQAIAKLLSTKLPS